MAIGIGLSPSVYVASQHSHQATVSKTAPFECTCGARAYEEKHALERQRRVAPIGLAGVMLLREVEKDSDKKIETQPHEDDHATPTRKRSLWRKILGKGPKCICEKLQKEKDAKKPKLIQIPSDYEGCLTVRVAGKRVPFTREMQRVKRLAYSPMDAISEESDDAM